jgi:hypothetical protein
MQFINSGLFDRSLFTIKGASKLPCLVKRVVDVGAGQGRVAELAELGIGGAILWINILKLLQSFFTKLECFIG